MAGDKFPFSLCPTGIVPTRANSEHVPLTPTEVAQDVADCLAMGISSVHLHARDEKGANSNRPETFAEFIAAVRYESEDVVICVSCSGRIEPDLEPRSAVLSLPDELRPDMGSLTLGSLNFSRSASINAPDVVVGLAEKMQERGIKPELEIFDIGMMNYAHYMIGKGYLQPPYLFNIILGNPFSGQADPLHLGAILKELPEDSIWCVGGIGRQQTAAVALGLASGGGVRVGLEDNLWFDQERTIAASNTTLVERTIQIASSLERTPMSPGELRKVLAL
jgi:3-oxoadipate:acetyl-CoA acetyltransferase